MQPLPLVPLLSSALPIVIAIADPIVVVVLVVAILVVAIIVAPSMLSSSNSILAVTQSSHKF